MPAEAIGGPQLADGVSPWMHWALSMVRLPRGSRGFQVVPKRWMVERTFAWMGRYRRSSRDYEGLSATSEAWVQITNIERMLHCLSAT